LAPELRSLLGALENRYYTRGQVAFWCAAGGFTGITVWGHLNEEDARELRRVIEAVLDTHPQERWPQRTSLLDASDVVAVDPRAFEIMAEHFAAQGGRVKERPVRQAMVRPRGFTGSVVAGFFSVTRPPFETAVFTSVGDAVDWLGGTEPTLAGDIDLLRQTLTQSAAELTALQRVLEADVSRLTLASAARKLGLSSRTLQRRLQAAGTTFHAQRSAVQVRTAQLMLSQTTDKIGAIARAVGCSSAPQFSALFRRLTGESPREFRERARPH
jgi:AraC-like DNA-binding protein